MRSTLLLSLAVLALACGGAGSAGSAPPETSEQNSQPPPQGVSPAEEAFHLANLERRDAGLPELEWHAGAAAVALAHSEDMAARGYFDHVTPEGLDAGDRLDLGGVSWSGWAENIARGYPDAGSVTAGWMASPGHRENLLLPWVTHMGVGVADGPAGPYWTQILLAGR